MADTGRLFVRDFKWDYPIIERGSGAYLYDTEGNEYFDACSGAAAATLGHGNEEIAEAMAAQAKKVCFTHQTRFTHAPVIDLANAISQIAPGDLGYTYFTCGGSESVDAAIKLARQYYLERDGQSSKYKVISRRVCFHGNTIGALSCTDGAGLRKKFAPLLLNFPRTCAAYCYRCELGKSKETCGCECAYALEDTILREGAENISGFIFEPVIGSSASGSHPNPDYYKIIREICNKYDILMIADEVMNGFGRTGEYFAMQNFGVVPDVMCVAKGISAAYIPLGGIVVSEKVMSVFKNGPTGKFVHGHTYTGLAISCAVGNKVLEILERDQLVKNAKEKGAKLKQRLIEELSNNRIVGDVRGLGLQLGVEFVKDKSTKQPFGSEEKIAARLTKAGLQNGIVLYPGSGNANVICGDLITLAPPLTITDEQVEEIVRKLKASVEQVEGELPK